MSTEPTPSPMQADIEILKSEIKALKEIIGRLQSRMEQIEDELTAIRNLL